MKLSINLASQPNGFALTESENTVEELFSKDYEKVENLVAYIQKKIQTHYKKDIKDITQVIISTGPGSYTGLRLSTTIANTLSQALDIPVVGISTLYALAHTYITSTGTYIVTIPGRKDDINAALFSANGKIISRITPDFVWGFDEFTKSIPKFTVPLQIIGQLENQWAEAIKDHSNITYIPRLLDAHSLFKIPLSESKDKKFVLPQYSHEVSIGQKKKK